MQSSHLSRRSTNIHPDKDDLSNVQGDEVLETTQKKKLKVGKLTAINCFSTYCRHVDISRDHERMIVKNVTAIYKRPAS